MALTVVEFTYPGPGCSSCGDMVPKTITSAERRAFSCFAKGKLFANSLISPDTMLKIRRCQTCSCRAIGPNVLSGLSGRI